MCILTNFITAIFIINHNKPPANQNQTVNINQEPANKKIDINTASKEELSSIAGIGEKTAQNIIENRPYKDIWELENIKGISKERIYQLEKEVEVK